MTTRIVLASGNAGKLRELRQMCAGLPVELTGQQALGVDSPPEDALTFVENALIKARHAAAVTGLPAIADDSGLEVPALDGRPGIHSARYAGAGASDADNITRLLQDMRELRGAQRRARFRCVLVFLRHAADPAPIISSGLWEGYILEAPRGDSGFGYDPVFLVAGEQCTAAELPAADKNRRSHRGQALTHLLTALEQELNR